LSVRAP